VCFMLGFCEKNPEGMRHFDYLDIEKVQVKRGTMLRAGRSRVREPMR
jgi:hypothetical protein